MRTLGIDPGEKNIGIAISDPTGTIANPMVVLKHLSRSIDAASIAQIAAENDVGIIVVGQALSMDGKPTLSGRRATRLAAAIRTQTEIEVVLWDESYSTKTAQRGQRIFKAPRRKSNNHIDDLAAAVILQSFLEYSERDP